MTIIDVLRNRAHDRSNQKAYIFLQDGENESDNLSYRDLDLN